MKAATRLEISKKDIDIFLDVLNDSNQGLKTQSELVNFYRSQLHQAFKMGLVSNNITPIEEE